MRTQFFIRSPRRALCARTAQINDDLEFVSPLWSELFIALLANASIPGVGACSAQRGRLRSMLTAAVVAQA
jgi:hypothetical protein